MVSKIYVRLDPGGAYKVGDTRVSLDSVVYAYLEGGSAESVEQSYPGLGMENIYGALAFYFANRDEVNEYLKKQEALAEKIRAEIEAQPVPPVVARLRALRAAQQGQP